MEPYSAGSQLEPGLASGSGPSKLAVVVAVILAVLGLAMAVYLISVHDPRDQSGTD
jgi:hypothetical protein